MGRESFVLDKLHFSFFLHFCKVTVLYDLSLTALAAAPLPNRAVRDAREIGSFRDSPSFHRPLISLASLHVSKDGQLADAISGGSERSYSARYFQKLHEYHSGD